MVHLKADLVTPRFLEHVLAAPFMRDIPVAELPQPGTCVAGAVRIMNGFPDFHLDGRQGHPYDTVGKKQPDQHGDKHTQQHRCNYKQNLSGTNLSHGVICF